MVFHAAENAAYFSTRLHSVTTNKNKRLRRALLPVFLQSRNW